MVSFSGGKDSQAALIHTVEKYGGDRLIAAEQVMYEIFRAIEIEESNK